MSKADHILESNKRSSRSRRKPGFLTVRGRLALLVLTTLLILFVFFTQPQIRTAFVSWASLAAG